MILSLSEEDDDGSETLLSQLPAAGLATCKHLVSQIVGPSAVQHERTTVLQFLGLFIDAAIHKAQLCQDASLVARY